MSDKTKEVILKVLLITGLGTGFGILPVSILLAFLPIEEKIVANVAFCMLFICLGCGVLFMILLPIFGSTTESMKRKSVKADQAPHPFTAYSDFAAFLEKQLTQRGYHMQKALPILPDGEVLLYVKPAGLLLLSCFAVIRAESLSKAQLESADEKITDILTDYCGGSIIKDVNMTSIFCVEHITPAFQKLLNSNVEQDLKTGRLLVGLSFQNNTIYIAKQKGGFAIAKYKRLRREFVDLLGVPSVR